MLTWSRIPIDFTGCRGLGDTKDADKTISLTFAATARTRTCRGCFKRRGQIAALGDYLSDGRGAAFWPYQCCFRLLYRAGTQKNSINKQLTPGFDGNRLSIGEGKLKSRTISSHKLLTCFNCITHFELYAITVSINFPGFPLQNCDKTASLN